MVNPQCQTFSGGCGCHIHHGSALAKPNSRKTFAFHVGYQNKNHQALSMNDGTTLLPQQKSVRITFFRLARLRNEFNLGWYLASFFLTSRWLNLALVLTLCVSLCVVISDILPDASSRARCPQQGRQLAMDSDPGSPCPACAISLPHGSAHTDTEPYIRFDSAARCADMPSGDKYAEETMREGG